DERPVLAVEELRTALFLRGGVGEGVRGVSFDIRRGETLGLVGESGCGKSMTALSIMRLVPDPPGPVVGGAARLDGTDLRARSEPEMRRLRGDRVSMIFQEPLTSLDPVFAIGAQMTDAVRVHRKLGEREARELALAMLEEVEIPSPRQRFDAYPHQ